MTNNQELKAQFSRNIRWLIVRSESATKLAKIWRVDRKSLYDWMKGESYPQAQMLVRIHLYGGVDLHKLLTADLWGKEPCDWEYNEYNEAQ